MSDGRWFEVDSDIEAAIHHFKQSVALYREGSFETSGLSGYRELARVAKVGALGGISLSAVALIHDLGRPDRFLNMLRVFKPSSPMSMGSWLLVAYGPLAGAAAVSDVTGILPRAGRAATAGAPGGGI